MSIAMLFLVLEVPEIDCRTVLTWTELLGRFPMILSFAFFVWKIGVYCSVKNLALTVFEVALCRKQEIECKAWRRKKKQEWIRDRQSHCNGFEWRLFEIARFYCANDDSRTHCECKRRILCLPARM